MLSIYIWIISFLAIAGVIIRPFKMPEAVWAVAGAALLVALQLIVFRDAIRGIAKGTDVYLFLTGMMLLAETAREEKLFDWFAAQSVKMAKGSGTQLFLLLYLVGIVVTTFLSNDATAVVLTPAVAAAVRAAHVQKPLPYLLICAFVANAASFLLPISNPANLVIYGSHMPALLQWLPLYIFPSAASVIITYVMLRLTQRNNLQVRVESNIEMPGLSNGGKTAMIGIAGTAVILMISSAMDFQLGLPVAITGVVTAAIVAITVQKKPWAVIKGVSWSVLPLVAGLFVIVEALSKTGLTESLSSMLHHYAAVSAGGTVWGSGFIIAFACNLLNNLPAGLIAGNVVAAGHVADKIRSSILIGVDVGPNLSLTGSLATILWLVALRREGQTCSAWTFLKLAIVIMIPALIFSIAALWINI